VVAAIGIALLVLAGCRAQQTATTTPAASAAATGTAAASSEKITVGPDEAACPVMGTVMKKADMIPMQHNGKTFAVCCRECQAKFKADPEKYINHPAPLTRQMPN
jgi:YHS domain-containing protein